MPYIRPWDYSLCGSACDDADDGQLCFESLFCRWCQNSAQYNRLSNDAVGIHPFCCLATFLLDIPTLGLASWMLTCTNRANIQARYGLRGSYWDVCFTSLCCLPCALCQQHRQMTFNKEFPGGLCLRFDDSAVTDGGCDDDDCDGGGGGGGITPSKKNPVRVAGAGGHSGTSAGIVSGIGGRGVGGVGAADLGDKGKVLLSRGNNKIASQYLMETPPNLKKTTRMLPAASPSMPAYSYSPRAASSSPRSSSGHIPIPPPGFTSTTTTPLKSRTTLKPGSDVTPRPILKRASSVSSSSPRSRPRSSPSMSVDSVTSSPSPQRLAVARRMDAPPPKPYQPPPQHQYPSSSSYNGYHPHHHVRQQQPQQQPQQHATYPPPPRRPNAINHSASLRNNNNNNNKNNNNSSSNSNGRYSNSFEESFYEL